MAMWGLLSPRGKEEMHAYEAAMELPEGASLPFGDGRRQLSWVDGSDFRPRDASADVETAEWVVACLTWVRT